MAKKRNKSNMRKTVQDFDLEVIDLTEEEPEVDIDSIPEVTVDESELSFPVEEPIVQKPVEAVPEIDISTIPEVTVDASEALEEGPEIQFNFVRRVPKKKNRFDKKFIGIIAAAAVVVLVIAGVVGFNIYESSVVYKTVRVEAGIEVGVADFLKSEDPKAVFAVKEIMRRLCGEGCAVFFSTHVLDVAEKLCNRVGIIRDGKLVACGSMEEVRGNESLEDVFMELIEQ